MNSPTPEPCTSPAATKRHQSITLASPVTLTLPAAGLGRAGRTLCGLRALDHEAAVRRRQSRHGWVMPLEMMPPCASCDGAAARLAAKGDGGA